MKRINASRIASFWLLFSQGLFLLNGCNNPGNQISNPLRISGRVSFGENLGCASAVFSQDTQWDQCHLFKKHFDATTGDPIVANDYIANSLRPLPVAIEFSVFDATAPGSPKLCAQTAIQASLLGEFDAVVSGCGAGKNIEVVAKVLLQNRVTTATGAFKYIRAVWREDLAAPLFPNFGDEVNHTIGFSRTIQEAGEDGIVRPKTVRYAIPTLGFRISMIEPNLENGAPPETNIGNRVFLSNPQVDSYGYMRQVLSAYTTLVELHYRLLNQFVQEGKGVSYDALFIKDTVSGWSNSYTIWFDAVWAYGWKGGMALLRPNIKAFEQENGSWGAARLLSGVDVISHEFGHSIHAALAPSSFFGDYGFADPLQRSDNSVYSWGHGGVQYQNLGTAFSEGFASSLGQFLVNACGGSVAEYRPQGGVDPFGNNMWNGDKSCDAQDGCNYHHTRYHLAKRGLSEGSVEWQKRETAAAQLTRAASGVGHRWVTSNSETRLAEFGCDLLDRDTNVDHTIGKIAGQKYLNDFTFSVAEILEGKATPYTIKQYQSDPTSEDVVLKLTQFIQVMNQFCPNCKWMPTVFGSAYNTQRLSVATGLQSPRVFLKYAESQGWIQRSQSENLLKSNFMETID